MPATIHFHCPSCGAARVASTKIVGRRVRCPECNHMLRVPEKSEEGTHNASSVDKKSADASESFDPYYKWLAIPPSEQPPNYYRLLGVALFEPDINVIAVSADRQMVHVKAQATGRYGQHSQKLLNELARARACLLEPRKRAEYDAQLRTQEKAKQTARGAAVQAPQPTAAKPAAPVARSAEGTSARKPAPINPRHAAARTPPAATSTPAVRPIPASRKPASPRPAAASRQAVAGVSAPTGTPLRTNRTAKPADKPIVRPWQDEPPAEPAIAFGSQREDSEAEMDMTPMVDVTFLLLIFFMVTAAFSLQKSIQMPTAKSDQPSPQTTMEDIQENPDFVTVHVDSFNTYHVQTAEWEEEAPSEHEMLIRLRRARQGNKSGKIPTRLLVSAHLDALYEKVIAAMDAGTEVGMEEVQLVTTEEEFD